MVATTESLGQPTLLCEACGRHATVMIGRGDGRNVGDCCARNRLDRDLIRTMAGAKAMSVEPAPPEHQVDLAFALSGRVSHAMWRRLRGVEPRPVIDGGIAFPPPPGEEEPWPPGFGMPIQSRLNRRPARNT